jgi:hypothetical protein
MGQKHIDHIDFSTNRLPVENLPIEIAKGNVAGHSSIHKFGNAPDFDTGDNAVDVWDGANDGGSNLMSYTYSTTDDIDSLSSSNDGDTVDIEITGLDANYDLVTQTITLTGQTRVALTTDLVRVFRLKNVGGSNLAGRVYCFVNVATTLGVPDTLANVRAEINNGNNQTLMALYTVPNGKTGYMDQFEASIAGAKKTAEYQIDLYIRPFGQVFQLDHRTSLQDGGTSQWQHLFEMPEKLEAKTDIAIKATILTGSVTGANISAGFDLILVDD